MSAAERESCSHSSYGTSAARHLHNHLLDGVCLRPRDLGMRQCPLASCRALPPLPALLTTIYRLPLHTTRMWSASWCYRRLLRHFLVHRLDEFVKKTVQTRVAGVTLHTAPCAVFFSVACARDHQLLLSAASPSRASQRHGFVSLRPRPHGTPRCTTVIW